MKRTATLDNYCLFWARDDDEDRPGQFLDPDQPLSHYPDLATVRLRQSNASRSPVPRGADTQMRPYC